MDVRRKRTQKAATRPLSPDAELARAFAVGCGVLLLAFFCGWVTISFFWLQ